MPITNAVSRTGARSGRALVECLVSLVLVSGASSLVLLLVSTTAHVVDHARQRDLVLRESSRLRASLLRAPCLATAGTWRRDIDPRTVLEAAVTTAGGLHALTVTATWTSSGWGGRKQYSQHTSAAGWCE